MFKSYIYNLYYKYNDQYLAIMPFCICLGVIFGVKHSLDLHIAIPILCIALMFIIVLDHLERVVFVPFFLFIFGISVSSFHLYIKQNKTENCELSRNVELTVTIEQIVYGTRPILFGKTIDSHGSGCAVKINNLSDHVDNLVDVVAGDVISFNGSLSRPAAPIYAKEDRIYINKLSNQYFRAKIISDLSIKKKTGFNFFNKLRASISEHVRQLTQKNNSNGYGIIAALTIGNTGFIEESALDNIRKSGFAHLLAISGLHLGTIIGIIVVIIRLILSYVPYICLRFDTKKIAACIAIVFSFFYIQITNGSISVQRSFIMSGLLLFGIAINRKAIMLRVWSAALFYVVVFTPDKIFTPSMQMSFVATFTLITVYQKFSRADDLIVVTNKNSLLFYIFAIFFSSFIAGFTTMFYEAYHFGQWSVVGLISNEVAIPITEFMLLPISMLAVLFTGTWFGEKLYNLAGFFGDVLVYLADVFANQKFSYFLVKAMPSEAILMITVGIYAIFLTLNRYSLIGGLILCCGIFVHVTSPKPLIILDKYSGSLVYLDSNNSYYLTRQIDNLFVHKILSKELAQKDFVVQKQGIFLKCADEVCLYNNNKIQVCILGSGVNRVSSPNNICPKSDHIVDLRKSSKSYNNVISYQDILRSKGSLIKIV